MCEFLNFKLLRTKSLSFIEARTVKISVNFINMRPGANFVTYGTVFL